MPTSSPRTFERHRISLPWRRGSLRQRHAILLAVVVFLASCNGDPADRATTDANGELDRLVTQNTGLVERVDEIERQLEQLLGDDDSIDVNRLIEDLARVEAMADQLAEEREARLAFAQRVEELEQDLRTSIVDLRDDLQALRGLIDDLEIRYQVLQQRIDRLG